MSVDDISPATRPFSTRLRELASLDHQAARAVFDYVDLAKRMLLELRVRDFSASDVVALATVMEARDRALNTTSTVK